MHYNSGNCSIQRQDAIVMDKCDRNLRRSYNRSTKEWHRAGVEFLREGLQRGCLGDLNELGDLLGSKSWLSERSYDLLFESGTDTDDFIRHLRTEATADPGFEQQLRGYFGDRILERELTPPPQMDMFS